MYETFCNIYMDERIQKSSYDHCFEHFYSINNIRSKNVWKKDLNWYKVEPATRWLLAKPSTLKVTEIKFDTSYCNLCLDFRASE